MTSSNACTTFHAQIQNGFWVVRALGQHSPSSGALVPLENTDPDEYHFEFRHNGAQEPSGVVEAGPYPSGPLPFAIQVVYEGGVSRIIMRQADGLVDPEGCPGSGLESARPISARLLSVVRVQGLCGLHGRSSGAVYSAFSDGQHFTLIAEGPHSAATAHFRPDGVNAATRTVYYSFVHGGNEDGGTVVSGPHAHVFPFPYNVVIRDGTDQASRIIMRQADGLAPIRPQG